MIVVSIKVSSMAGQNHPATKAEDSSAVTLTLSYSISSTNHC